MELLAYLSPLFGVRAERRDHRLCVVAANDKQPVSGTQEVKGRKVCICSGQSGEQLQPGIFRQRQTQFSSVLVFKGKTISPGLVLLSVLPRRTFSCVVLQQQFLPSPLNAAQHIEAAAQAGGEGNVVGQGHGEPKVR